MRKMSKKSLNLRGNVAMRWMIQRKRGCREVEGARRRRGERVEGERTRWRESGSR